MLNNARPSAATRRRVSQSELDLLVDAHERLLNGRPAGRRLSLKFADLSGLNLVGRNLSDADLSGSTFDGCSMAHVRFERANLFGCDLRKADLRYAILARADLRGACLRGANLAWAIGRSRGPLARTRGGYALAGGPVGSDGW